MNNNTAITFYVNPKNFLVARWACLAGVCLQGFIIAVFFPSVWYICIPFICVAIFFGILMTFFHARKKIQVISITGDGISVFRRAPFVEGNQLELYIPWQQIRAILPADNPIKRYDGMIRIEVDNLQQLRDTQPQMQPNKWKMGRGNIIFEQNNICVLWTKWLNVSTKELLNILNARLQQYREQHRQ